MEKTKQISLDDNLPQEYGRILSHLNIHAERAKHEGISYMKAKARNHGDAYNIDGFTSSVIRQLHPTLRRCKCGYTDISHKVTKHIWSLMKQTQEQGTCAPHNFWQFHGEIPLNIGDE